MLLILDEPGGAFGALLASVAEARGLPTLALTPAQLAHEVTISFWLDGDGARLRLRHGATSLDARQLAAVYCGIETFSPATWSAFSAEDADYAAREAHALWLAVLASLPCGLVNPPALDALGGTALPRPELLVRARAAGFEVPGVATVEHGRVAARVARQAPVASVTDLGDRWTEERPLSAWPALERSRHEVRLTEAVPGRTIHLAQVGRSLLASAQDEAGTLRPMPASEVPPVVRARLRALQRELRLRVAEYAFQVTPRGRWVLTGASRPPRAAALVQGEALCRTVLDEVVGRASA